MSHIDHPRSCPTLIANSKLDKEHDHYPLFSQTLVTLQDALYRHCVLGEVIPAIEEQCKLMSEAIGEDICFLTEEVGGAQWKERVRKILMRIPYEEETYNNGAILILRRLFEALK